MSILNHSTSIPDKETKINAFAALGRYLLNPDEELSAVIKQAKNRNAWFTEEQVQNAIKATGTTLNKSDLESWISGYTFDKTAKKIGLVLAGNIPMVGFHDILSVLLSGNVALIKTSSNDEVLIPYLLNKLIDIEPAFKQQIVFVHRLQDFDAIIATGSNNTSRYFEHYFSKVPHIIRKNRNSIAILTGDESTAELKGLGKDILDYFGLGCRSVSKIYVPEGYNFIPFFEAIEEYHAIIHHHKYNNNYDYNKSIFLVNKVEHLDNGFLLLARNEALNSPLSVVFYEEYKDTTPLKQKIKEKQNDIQVIVTHTEDDYGVPKTRFGNSQQPSLWDYADGVDTLKFLSSLTD